MTLSARTLVVVAGLALVASDAGGQPDARRYAGRTFVARVASVSDGDTILVLPQGSKDRIRVRVFGVDAPEQGEPFSGEALTFLRVLVFDRDVRVTGRDVDRYDRLVATIAVDGRDAAVELLQAGLACHLTQFSTERTHAAAQAAAQSARRGFWGAATRPRCAQPSDARLSAVSAEVRGNRSSRVYHAATCRNYRCRNCTAVFATRQAAEAAGYRPARDCFR